MRTSVRAMVVVVVAGGLGALSWTAADACIGSRPPPPGAVPMTMPVTRPASMPPAVAVQGPTELETGAVVLVGLAAVAATRRPRLRHVPCAPD